ncbi:very short patch repair endonuclease [Rhizobium pusense]|uniref:Very short patch repair endonuclease n=2 Tax=Agrobacterium pusense TaxID=648995 RepID=A0A6H0ZMU2_9HYPH|nr:very short patch repair endonuclease [Agrobacterium pusense]MDH2091167.1 very short patch repair endonuclease [Agrobacterium pusense]QIX21324.1 DNA mismatch endonuclease Vsr [Agrobacterium pusense]
MSPKPGTSAHRAWNMSRIRGKDTKPELTVRRLLFADGFRYRLHGADLPGRPDIVFRSRKKVMFVHGCFWHQHCGCRNANIPKTRTDFWTKKLAGNVSRDQAVSRQLHERGWSALIIWECETKDVETLRLRLHEFLSC